MKKIIILVLLLFTSFTSFSQEDIEEMMRKMQEATQKEINKSNKAVQDFIDENDRAFAEFLKKDWEMFQAFQGIKRDEKPKPVKIPKAPPSPKPILKGQTIKKIVIPQKTIITKPKPLIKIPEIKRAEKSNINFFGQNLDFYYDKNFCTFIKYPINNQSISEYWKSLSATDFAKYIEQLSKFRQQFQLNDFGFAQLIYHSCEKIFSNKENERLLFTWFILSKTGYDVKTGFNSSQVYLLIYTQNMLFSTPFLKINNRQYFVVHPAKMNQKVKNIYTYKGEYPGSKNPVNFNITSPINISSINKTKQLQFKYQNNSYSIPVNYNPYLINYYENYPQTNYEVYFTSPVSFQTKLSLVKSLKPIIENKTQPEAVDIILRFVQTSFQYQTDDENFGREKPLFPEETIYYQYSDCEDRSILFAFLIQELVGLEVIGLKYEGHMATAVNFSTPMKGDVLNVQGKQFLICDPTYINANIGLCMPQFKGKLPEIIKIKS